MKGFIMIPNWVVTRSDLSPYDKTIIMVLSTFHPTFPSYQKIREYTGLSYDRINKSLHKLEEANIIRRYRDPNSKSQKIYYVLHWSESPKDAAVEQNFQRIRFDKKVIHNESKTYPQEERPFRNTEGTIPPDGIRPFRITETNNIKRTKINNKKGKFEIFKESESENLKPLSFAELIAKAKSKTDLIDEDSYDYPSEAIAIQTVDHSL